MVRSVIGVGVIALILACGGAPRGGSARATIPPRCAAYVDLPPAEAWTPEQVIRGNLQAVMAEDLDCSMACFHSESALYDSTRAMTEGIFGQYDLVYELRRADPPVIVGDVATVTFEQSTRSRVADPMFRNNVIVGVHELHREDGRWRLWNTTIVDVRFE